ncbi:membrane protein insertase YidC [Numidum massiliense]|uniref:membrane protein insertase YidC n=1 Tax=Numidum massiliense TaxID=1522315 RepID=UPI000ADD2002
MLRRKRYVAITLIICFAVVMAGCSTADLQKKEIDPNNGFWDRFFVYPLNLALEWFAKLLFNIYGLSILVVTIILRLLILPLTVKQLKSSKAMQAIQPEMKKIQEKYRNNQQKMQEETMKLMQKHNVNPLAGCLPLLVQMPILIAFYQAIMRNAHISEASFLWLQLGSPDPYYILPVVAGITTYLQQKLITVNTNPQMKAMLTIMPLFIVFVAINLPSALALYWVYGNLFTMVQSYFLRDMYNGRKEGAVK